eukprot:scaffold25044_cov21-Tisochrysis_lutea.AAC.2
MHTGVHKQIAISLRISLPRKTCVWLLLTVQSDGYGGNAAERDGSWQTRRLNEVRKIWMDLLLNPKDEEAGGEGSLFSCRGVRVY